MISGHLDEIWLYRYTRLMNKDTFYFTPIGGWWNQVMLSQKVITTESA